jgi:hypothetical protein
MSEPVDAALKASLLGVQLPYGDVLGEFGASDMTPVLVDGDELLLSALRKERRCETPDTQNGGDNTLPQWLPVVFRVCHFLRRLTLSHLRFRVFFMAMKQLAYDPADLALRSALIRYLKVGLQTGFSLSLALGLFPETALDTDECTSLHLCTSNPSTSSFLMSLLPS